MIRRFLFSIVFLLTIGGIYAHNNNICPEDSCEVVSSDGIDLKLSRNIFAEYGGPSYGVGIGYDQRFNTNSIFGFRVGLGFTNGEFHDAPSLTEMHSRQQRDVKFKGVTLPLEVNSLLGYHESKFELGLGAAPCILDRTETEYDRIVEGGVKLNIYGMMNIGFRLQRRRGFFMRVGATFLLGEGKISPMDGLMVMPYLSLGYTIR